MSTTPSEGDDHALFGAAHADVWWAKGQQWNTTNWAVALLVGLAGLNQFLDSADPSRFADLARWLQVVVAFGAAAYIARLHYDMIRSRHTIAKLRERRPGLINPLLSKGQRRHPIVEEVRGASFPLLQIASISLTFTLCAYSVNGASIWSISMGVVHLVAGLIFIVCSRESAT